VWNCLCLFYRAIGLPAPQQSWLPYVPSVAAGLRQTVPWYFPNLACETVVETAVHSGLMRTAGFFWYCWLCLDQLHRFYLFCTWRRKPNTASLWRPSPLSRHSAADKGLFFLALRPLSPLPSPPEIMTRTC